MEFIIKIVEVHGNVITLMRMAYLNKRIVIRLLLADESTYNIDLNKDGSVGDVVAQVITNDGNGHGLYKTVSGSYVIDDS